MALRKITLFSFFLILFIFSRISSTAQNLSYSKIKGSWQGTMIHEKDSFNVVFDIYPDSTNSVLVSFPDVASVDNKPQRSRFTNDSLILSLPKMGANIKLFLINPTELSGFWCNVGGKDSTILVMRKTDNPLRVQRPQTPKSPFPYSSETIVIQNKKANISIEGTLTLPEGKGPFPSVILVTGSGPQDRNSEIMMHKSFWVIADFLTRRGVAVFRYDERGVGKSTGNYSNSTTLDFANDLKEIFMFLKKDSRLNKQQIGLMGHSEGGIVIGIVASQVKSVAFVISLAGSAVSGREILLEQAKQMNILNGKDSAFVEYDYLFRTKIFDAFISNSDKKIFAEKVRTLFADAIKELGEEKAKDYSITKSASELWILQLSSPWMDTFIRLNPADYWKKVNCPVLVLIGDKDFQVPYHQNMPVYESIFQNSKNKNVTLLKMESLNHLFQTANTGSMNEYARISETFSPKALTTISEWILKQTQSTPQN